MSSLGEMKEKYVGNKGRKEEINEEGRRGGREGRRKGGRKGGRTH